MWVSGGEELRRKGEWQLGYRCSPGGKERENAGRECDQRSKGVTQSNLLMLNAIMVIRAQAQRHLLHQEQASNIKSGEEYELFYHLLLGS